jgi:ubiquinone/menaquinone biosynthesis C-methylase UbiE
MLDYDKLAAEYARYRRIHPQVLKELLSTSTIDSRSNVLEVGCGTGNYISKIQELRGCVCWGIDPSAQMLAQARTQSSIVTFEAGRAEALPVADATFDLVFSVDVIHHLANGVARLDYFQHARRVLKPGGKVCTVTDSEWIIRNRPTLSAYFPETIKPELRRYPPISALRDEMRVAGFVSINEMQVEFTYLLDDCSVFRAKAYSALHLISQSAFEHGLARMERDLQSGPIQSAARYVLVWGS